MPAGKGRAFAIAVGDQRRGQRQLDHNRPRGPACATPVTRLGTRDRPQVRPDDCRISIVSWGGEEFSLAFPGENAVSAGGVVDRLLNEFRGQRHLDPRGSAFRSSFSAGVAEYPRDGDNLATLLQCADERLYAAKRSGKSRVICQ